MRFILLVGLAAGAWAQNTAAIIGTVSDLAGQPVPNAPVQATQLPSGMTYKATTGKDGVYKIEHLSLGNYEISVAVVGFNAFTQKVVIPAAVLPLKVDIHLVDYQFDTLGDGKEFQIQRVSPHDAPKGPTPKTSDGKPDFSGVWFAQRPVETPDPQMTPAAEKLFKQRVAAGAISPGARCLTRGITMAGNLFPYKIVQGRDVLIMLFEDDIPSHRQVFLDGRGHPKDPNPTWMGHSIGRWEGDTLVIDTVGFNDRSWVDTAGHPHTEQLHVIERYRRPDLGHLEIEFTILDPEVYVKPWTFKRAADLDAGDEVGEYVCNENEKDVLHMPGR
jgi:hypothetical protein